MYLFNQVKEWEEYTKARSREFEELDSYELLIE